MDATGLVYIIFTYHSSKIQLNKVCKDVTRSISTIAKSKRVIAEETKMINYLAILLFEFGELQQQVGLIETRGEREQRRAMNRRRSSKCQTKQR